MRERSISVPRVVDDHRADQRPPLVGEEVKLLAESVDADLEILDDRIALVLLLERVLARVPLIPCASSCNTSDEC
jgi:hypothetical protein